MKALLLNASSRFSLCIPSVLVSIGYACDYFVFEDDKWCRTENLAEDILCVGKSSLPLREGITENNAADLLTSSERQHCKSYLVVITRNAACVSLLVTHCALPRLSVDGAFDMHIEIIFDNWFYKDVRATMSSWKSFLLNSRSMHHELAIEVEMALLSSGGNNIAKWS
jgi:hypothetical protein